MQADLDGSTVVPHCPLCAHGHQVPRPHRQVSRPCPPTRSTRLLSSNPSRLDPLSVFLGWIPITVVPHCPLLGLSMPVDAKCLTLVVKYFTLVASPVPPKTLTGAARLPNPH